MAIIRCDRLDWKLKQEPRCKPRRCVMNTKLLAIVVVDQRFFVDLSENRRVETLVVDAGAELRDEAGEDSLFVRSRYAKPAERRCVFVNNPADQ